MESNEKDIDSDIIATIIVLIREQFIKNGSSNILEKIEAIFDANEYNSRFFESNRLGSHQTHFIIPHKKLETLLVIENGFNLMKDGRPINVFANKKSYRYDLSRMFNNE